jgi:hypothetical protein
MAGVGPTCTFSGLALALALPAAPPNTVCGESLELPVDIPCLPSSRGPSEPTREPETDWGAPVVLELLTSEAEEELTQGSEELAPQPPSTTGPTPQPSKPALSKPALSSAASHAASVSFAWAVFVPRSFSQRSPSYMCPPTTPSPGSQLPVFAEPGVELLLLGLLGLSVSSAQQSLEVKLPLNGSGDSWTPQVTPSASAPVSSTLLLLLLSPPSVLPPWSSSDQRRSIRLGGHPPRGGGAVSPPHAAPC